MENTIISTMYAIEPVMICITKFSPKKVILLREDSMSDQKSKVEQILNDTVGKFIELDPKITSHNNVVQVARDTAEVIEAENANGRKVVVNISGGQKIQALGALFGCYARNSMVEQIVYVNQDQQLVDLPILNYGISNTKRMVLEELKQGETSVKNLAVKIGISRGMTYNHIRELKEMGFIAQNELNITSAGELAVI